MIKDNNGATKLLRLFLYLFERNKKHKNEQSKKFSSKTPFLSVEVFFTLFLTARLFHSSSPLISNKTSFSWLEGKTHRHTSFSNTLTHTRSHKHLHTTKHTHSHTHLSHIHRHTLITQMQTNPIVCSTLSRKPLTNIFQQLIFI